ncbi:uncharacterized protein LOC144076057 isoform X2 [Stigmatopora argus]
MADTAVDTTATAEVTAKELKEKKEVEVEKKEEDKKDNVDAPANGTNGADHSDKVEDAAKEDEHKNGEGKSEEEAPPADKTDAQPVKRVAEEEEEKADTKKQKTEENGDSKDAEVEA